MSTISKVATALSNGKRYLWETLTNGDDGQPVTESEFPIRSVSVTGTFGSGGTVVIEGSNDGTNYHTLTDLLGVAISFTSDGLKQISEVTNFIRPSVTAGDGTTDLDVTLIAIK